MNRTFCLPLLALLPLFSAQAQSPAPAPAAAAADSTENETVHLSPFEVSASSDEGYLAQNSVSASRIATPISDLPFAVTAFTPQIIADTNTTELIDIARYASGVTNGSLGFNGGADKFTVRGFPQEAERNGFYEGGTGNPYVDTSDIEQVEVVKGPASLLYGQIAPGGTVNYITKHAELKPFATVTFSEGSYDYARSTIDINQPLIGKTLLFRLNGAWQRDIEYEWGAKGHVTSLNPTLTWNVNSKLSVKLDASWLDKRESPTSNFPNPMAVSTPASVVAALNNAAGGYPATTNALTNKTGIDVAQGFSDSSDPGAFLRPYPLLDHQYNSSSSQDWRRTLVQSEGAEIDYNLNSHWIVRANFDYNFDRVDQYQTGVANSVAVVPPNSLVYSGGAWAVAPGWTALSAAQQLAAEQAFAQALIINPQAAVPDLQNGTPGPVVNVRRPRLQWNWGSSRTAQAEAAGNYDFGWMKLKPLVGFYSNVSSTNARLDQALGNAASPDFRTWDVNPYSPTFYINQNTPAIYGTAALPNVTQNNLTYDGDTAAYGLINATFLKDRLFLVGGARYNESRARVTNYLPGGGYQPGIDSHYTTPQVGVGFKVVDGVMLYASYSESYQLNTANPYLAQVVNGVSVPSGPAAPTTGTGYDTGIKTDLFGGKLSSTLSFYQVTQDNVVTQFNQQVNGANVSTVVQGASVRGRGVEYELTWSPIKNWQTFGSVSEEDIRNTAEPVGFLFYLGEHPAETAKTLANLWSRYTFEGGFLNHFWVGGGANYTGPSAVNNVNPGSREPGYTLWNSAFGYDWTWSKVRMSAVLNWQNMTNVYYQPVYSAYGLPERFTGTLTFRF